ncbi:SpoIID/LytB domain-containing protein [soil metagenome]
MKLISALLIILFCGPIHAASVAPGDVSVRLRPLKGVISIAGTDLKVVSSISSQSVPLLELKGFDRLSFRYLKSANSKKWIVMDPMDERVLATVDGSKVEIRGDALRVDLRPAPGHIELVAKPDDRKEPLSLIGFLSIEEYLEGVVASEVPGDWPMEALKAQAVAARSFTVAKIRERSAASPDWLLESNVTDQVFDYERGHSRATDAVRETKGEVLTSDAGAVVAANYHSDCGGRTDEARSIWGGGIKTGTAVDTACSVKRSPWRFVRSLGELTSSLMGRGLIPSGFHLASLSVLGRTSGGRALTLQARSPEGRTALIAGEKLRAAVGYGDLKSTLFEIKMGTAADGSQLEFIGRGFGHGTGLCQWGARELAKGGKTYRQILQHYYPLLTVNR